MELKERVRSEILALVNKNLSTDQAIRTKAVMDSMGFFDAPASTKYHGNYPGGLAEHSLQVAKNLMMLTERLELEWNWKSAPLLVGLLHDICKCDQYKNNPAWVEGSNEPRYLYQNDSIYSHHGEKSICILASSGLVLTQEEVACIRWHMGAYETDTNEWKYYGNAIAKYPNVLWTHTADMMASHIQGV